MTCRAEERDGDATHVLEHEHEQQHEHNKAAEQRRVRRAHAGARNRASDGSRTGSYWRRCRGTSGAAVGLVCSGGSPVGSEDDTAMRYPSVRAETPPRARRSVGF